MHDLASMESLIRKLPQIKRDQRRAGIDLRRALKHASMGSKAGSDEGDATGRSGS
jgi:hypothetical protein